MSLCGKLARNLIMYFSPCWLDNSPSLKFVSWCPPLWDLQSVKVWQNGWR